MSSSSSSTSSINAECHGPFHLYALYSSVRLSFPHLMYLYGSRQTECVCILYLCEDTYIEISQYKYFIIHANVNMALVFINNEEEFLNLLSSRTINNNPGVSSLAHVIYWLVSPHLRIWRPSTMQTCI